MFKLFNIKTKEDLKMFASIFFSVILIMWVCYLFFGMKSKVALYEKMNSEIIMVVKDLVRPECLVK